MGSSRQEYWSGLPFHSPGDLPNPEIKSRSPSLWADSLLSEQPGKPKAEKLIQKQNKMKQTTTTTYKQMKKALEIIGNKERIHKLEDRNLKMIQVEEEREME